MDETINKPATFLHIENFGCSVSLNENYNSFLFHCLIDDCNFHSKQVVELLPHLKDHPQVKWLGICYTCKCQILNKKDDLRHELQHFSEKHYDRSEFQSWRDYKLPTLQNALITARKRRKESTARSYTQTEMPLTTAIESDISTPEVHRLTIENETVLNKEYNSEEPALIDHSDTSVVPPLQEIGSISDEQLNIDSESVVQTQVDQATLVISDDDDVDDVKSPVEKMPRKRATVTGPTSTERPRDFHYKCWYCPLSQNSWDKIHSHWQEAKDGHKDHPFMFTIERVFKCFYCRACNTYEDLKGHSNMKHKGKTFAMIDNLNEKRCGLGCGTTENKMDDHFRENHKDKIGTAIKIADDLNNELLDRVIAEIRGTMNDNSDIDESRMFRCCICPETESDESAIVSHIRTHFIELKCTFEKCNSRFKEESLLKEHIKHTHPSLDSSDDETYPNIDVMEFLDKYAEMQITFSNGLVLTKGECRHNRYGRMGDIINIVRQIDKKDFEARKREQELP